MNWYVYVGNNPLIRIDPNGLEWVENDDGSRTATEDTDYLVDVYEDLGYESWQEAAEANYIDDFFNEDGEWVAGDFTLKDFTLLPKATTDEMSDLSDETDEAMQNEMNNENGSSLLDVFESWSDKEIDEPLTEAEANLQMGIGISEMIVGGIGVGTGAGTQAGIFVFADGGWVTSKALQKKKATPGSMLFELLKPSTTVSGETYYHYYNANVPPLIGADEN